VTPRTGDGDGDSSKDPGAGKKVEPKAEKPTKPPKKETAAEKRARLKREKKERERKEKERKEREARNAAKNTSKSTGGCDEITCLVDSSKACCRKGRTNNNSNNSDSKLPDRPTKAQVRSGMGRVSGSAKSCGKRNGWSGKVRVRIRISGSGRVGSAKASGGPGKVNGCVSAAVKRARFPKTKSGLSFTYGYTL